MSADDTSILLATQGNLLGANLFAYWVRLNGLFKNFSWAGGPAAMRPIFTIYIPIFFSWVNGFGPIGWIVFGYICVNIVSIAAGFTTAYFSKKGVDFYIWYGFIRWKIT